MSARTGLSTRKGALRRWAGWFGLVERATTSRGGSNTMAQ